MGVEHPYSTCHEKRQFDISFIPTHPLTLETSICGKSKYLNFCVAFNILNIPYIIGKWKVEYGCTPLQLLVLDCFVHFPLIKQIGS